MRTSADTSEPLVEPLASDSSDEELYHRVRRGDLLAFDVLYGRYERRLLGFICKLVHNHHDAEDLFHEAFVSVLRSREVSFDRGSFCGWLYRIARNQCLNHLRSGRRQSELQHRAEVPSEPPSAEASVADSERAALLQQAVAVLPPLLAEIYQLRSAGLSYEEMAEVLRIPLGTVKSRMNQMTQRLRDDLANRLHGLPAAAPSGRSSALEPPLDGPAAPRTPARTGQSLRPSYEPSTGSVLPLRGEPPEPEKEYKAHGLRSN